MKINRAGQATKLATQFGGPPNGGNDLPPTLNGCSEENPENKPWNPFNPLGEATNWEEFVNYVAQVMNAGKSVLSHVTQALPATAETGPTGTTGTIPTIGVNPGTPAFGTTPGQGFCADPAISVVLAFGAGAAFWK
jgi:hypothetical protein